MPGAFDRSSKDARGLSVLDLAELAPGLGRVVRRVMRAGGCSRAELRQWAQALPEVDRLSNLELEEALKLLQAESWLVRLGEGEAARYQINLARRRSHVLDPDPPPVGAPTRRTAVTMKGLWDKLDDAEG